MNQNDIVVAIIEPVGGHGGMNYYDFGLASGLTTAQCKVIVYTSEETSVPDGLSFIVKKSFRGIWGEAPKLLRAAKFVYCLFSALIDAKTNGMTIIHYHFFHYTNREALCVKIAKTYGFKVVVTAHDIEGFEGKPNVKRTLRILTSVDKVIAHNEMSRQELISLISLPESKISIVPQGNHLDSINELPEKDVARRAIGLSPDDNMLLFFGQIKEAKRLDILLRSLPEVIKQYPNLKLVVAGKVWRSDFSIYERIIKENGLENSVIPHIRYISDDEVANYYRSADLVVLPYKKIYQSAVLFLAMSYKVPVLVSDIPGMTDIITDGRNGYVFKSENIASLSSKLITVLSDSEELERIGESGFNTVVTEYSWNRIGKMTSEVYKSININSQLV